LGGAYARLEPISSLFSSAQDQNLEFFLNTLWQTDSFEVNKVVGEINTFLQGFNTPQEIVELFNFEGKLLKAIKKQFLSEEDLKNPFYIFETVNFAKGYAGAQLSESFDEDKSSFLYHVWESDNNIELNFAVNVLDEYTAASTRSRNYEFGYDSSQEIPFGCLVSSSSDLAQLSCPVPTPEQIRAIEVLINNNIYAGKLDLSIDEQSRGCVHGNYLGGHLGSGKNTQSSFYMTQVSGSPYDYLVVGRDGSSKFYDGRTPGTRNLWEAKHKYGFIFSKKSDWSDLIAEMDREAVFSVRLARNCLFNLTYAFSNKAVGEFFDKRWRSYNKQYNVSIFPRDVQWISYTGPNNIPVK